MKAGHLSFKRTPFQKHTTLTWNPSPRADAKGTSRRERRGPPHLRLRDPVHSRKESSKPQILASPRGLGLPGETNGKRKRQPLGGTAGITARSGGRGPGTRRVL